MDPAVGIFSLPIRNFVLRFVKVTSAFSPFPTIFLCCPSPELFLWFTFFLNWVW